MTDQVPEFFKFYEEAAERTKAHAWTQSSWLLTLNSAVLAFSVQLYVEHADIRGFLFMEWLLCAAGLILCGYIALVLVELGSHIRNYWTAANRIAVDNELLSHYIGAKAAAAARAPEYKADFPRFIARLMVPAVLFAVAHLTWATYVTVLTPWVSHN